MKRLSAVFLILLMSACHKAEIKSSENQSSSRDGKPEIERTAVHPGTSSVAGFGETDVPDVRARTEVDSSETPLDDPGQNDSPSQNDPQDRPWLRLVAINYDGSGCGEGTVASNIAADAQAFTLSFSAFVAEIGSGIEAARKQRDCTIRLDFEHAQNWSLAPLRTFIRGFRELDAGITAAISGGLALRENMASRLDFQTSFEGPSEGDFVLSQDYDAAGETWSSCKTDGHISIELNTRIALMDTAGQGARGLITVDTVDGSLQQTTQLQWQRCP